MSGELDYAAAGIFTSLDGVPSRILGRASSDPVEICRSVRLLVLQPDDARRAGLPEERQAENQVRPAGRLVHRLLELDPRPLTEPREPADRVVGTCRHFAVLACALLRHHGIEARVRCGFATYFQPGQALDHWIVEHRQDDRWARLDPEVLGGDVVERPEDLTPEQFVTGGEAWSSYRRGEVDGAAFGVHGTTNFGPAEIRGNAVKDLAAIAKVEMLPWDEWGRMTEAYDGRTGEDYDLLLDRVAAACAADDQRQVLDVYAHPDLTVPDTIR